MTNHFGKSNFIVHFLQESGLGVVVGKVHMLLLDPTVRLTHDLHDFFAMTRLSPERSAASNQLFEAMREVIAQISVVSGNCVHSTGLHYALDLMRYGSQSNGTALDDSSLDITVVKLGDLKGCYFLRPFTEDSHKKELVKGLVGIRVTGTETSIVLEYPLCPSLALSLLQGSQLLEKLRVSLAESLHLQTEDEVPNDDSIAPRIRFYSSKDILEVNLTVNQVEAVGESEHLHEFLKKNEFVLPVIIFIKSTLKQLDIHPSQLTPYVATLMIVAFSRYCSHVYPLDSAQYYPYRREAVEPGYLLLSFLSFFSPPPRGQFDPKTMRLVPSHSLGILFDVGKETQHQHLSVSNRSECWWVTDFTRYWHNAAGSCVVIHRCRRLFECILIRLLRSYIGDALHPPAVKSHDDTIDKLEQGDAEADEAGEFVDSHEHLRFFLMEDL